MRQLIPGQTLEIGDVHDLTDVLIRHRAVRRDGVILSVESLSVYGKMVFYAFSVIGTDGEP